MTSIDRRLADLAARRHGLLTLDEVLATGMGRSQVAYRVRSGRWDRVGHGVYRLAGVPETWQQLGLIACLAAPDGATTSHLTSAALAGLTTSAPHPPHITVGLHRSVRSTTAVVHRARLGPVDYAVMQGVPTTTVARTLVDCAAVVGPRRLRDLVDTAFHRKLTTVGQVEAAWDHARLRPGRAGEVALREILGAWSATVQPGSAAEARLLRQIVEWGFSVPQCQVPVTDGSGRVIARIDVGWPAHRIGIEYDGTEHHGPSQWEHDEARHNAITALGWQLIHAGSNDLMPGSTDLRSRLSRIWPTALPA